MTSGHCNIFFPLYIENRCLGKYEKWEYSMSAEVKNQFIEIYFNIYENLNSCMSKITRNIAAFVLKLKSWNFTLLKGKFWRLTFCFIYHVSVCMGTILIIERKDMYYCMLSPCLKFGFEHKDQIRRALWHKYPSTCLPLQMLVDHLFC